MAKIKWKPWIQAGAVFGLLAWLIGAIFKFLFPDGLATISFAITDIDVGQQIRSGIDTGFGTKTLGILHGILPTGIWGFLTIVVSGMAVFFVGRFIYQLHKKGQSDTVRLMLIALYGSLGVGVILALLSGKLPEVPFISKVFATAIAFLMVSVAYVGLSKLKLTKKIAKVPA